MKDAADWTWDTVAAFERLMTDLRNQGLAELGVYDTPTHAFGTATTLQEKARIADSWLRMVLSTSTGPNQSGTEQSGAERQARLKSVVDQWVNEYYQVD